MTVVSAKSGSCRIHSVKVKPSTSGMFTSDSTSGTGSSRLVRLSQHVDCLAGTFDRRGLHAPVPSHLFQNEPVGSVVVDNQHASFSDTCRLDSGSISRVSPVANLKRAAKWKTLPSPTSLSAQMRPSIKPTKRDVIASPRPVPPCLRVVDASACVNA